MSAITKRAVIVAIIGASCYAGQNIPQIDKIVQQIQSEFPEIKNNVSQALETVRNTLEQVGVKMPN
jgi:hypothetical protein